MSRRLYYECLVHAFQIPADAKLHVGWRRYERESKWAATWVSTEENPFAAGIFGLDVDLHSSGWTWVAEPGMSILVDRQEQVETEIVRGDNGVAAIRIWVTRPDEPEGIVSYASPAK